MAGFACTMAISQTLSETVIGEIKLQGPIAGASIISSQGDNVALRERVGSKERFVTLQGPQPTFDRILPGPVWIRDRLVYLAVQDNKYFLIDGAKKILLGGRPTSPAVQGRPWPSVDKSHYLVFVSDSKSIGWYSDGVLQSTRFDKLDLVDISLPISVPLFVGTKNCVMKLIGQAASTKAQWDSVHWARASDDASTIFVYGTRAGLPNLRRNGTTILEESLQSFATSRDGQLWVGVVDRSAELAPSVVLLEDGKEALQVPVDATRQQLYFSANGSTWVWKILDDDYTAVTLKQRGKDDRRVLADPLEYHLSDDGTRDAYAVATTEALRIEISPRAGRIKSAEVRDEQWHGLLGLGLHAKRWASARDPRNRRLVVLVPVARWLAHYAIGPRAEARLQLGPRSGEQWR
jgi:hypothetical protein